MWAGVWRLLLYILIILTPLMIVATLYPHSGHPFLYELGVGFALIAIMIFAMQIVLAGRFKWITKPFGLDVVIRFHQYMAVFATCLIVAHPLLLAFSANDFDLIIGMVQPWYIWIGKAALTILLLNIFLSLFQPWLKIKFEYWRLIHNVLGPILIILAFIHSGFTGQDIRHSSLLQTLWIAIPTIFIVLFVYHRFIRPWLLRRHAYQVIDVKQEVPKVWTIKLAPSKEETIFNYLPGQFHFLTFHRSSHLPEEEHHWTISSSPTEKQFISSTIKESGDFTATIGQTKPGDIATIHGPFGRFSYLFNPKEQDLVFIAGGIGITPIMAMLRYMRDTQANLPVTLLYGSKNEKEIVFRKELDQMVQNSVLPLTLVYILSEPEETWRGEKGHIDQDKIERFCSKDLKGKAFYICGPQGLIDSTLHFLRQKGIKEKNIHVEIFSFLD